MEKFKMGTERLFLRSPNINVCFRISLEGDFTPKDFSLAMDRVCKRHPLLRCSIEIDSDHNAWFVPGAKPVEIEYYKQEKMPDWKIWHIKTDNTPFDFMRGPLLKACVIMGTSQTEIIILGHHIIGDGIGYLNLAKDILAALDGRPETAPHLPPANDTFLKGGKPGLLSRLYAKKLNTAWRKNKVHFSEDDYRDFFRDYRARFIPRLHVDSLNEAELKKLTELCKANRLTVNELITSAFAAALAAGREVREVRIGVAASTRGELTTRPYYCMGNYVTGISVRAEYDSGNDFMSNTAHITKMLREALTNAKKKHAIVNFLGEFDHDLIESIMFASYGNYDLPLSKKIGAIIAEGPDGKGLGISNLGRHEMNNYRGFRLLDVQFIGPAFPANILSVSILTVNNRLNICLRYNEAEMETNAVIMIYKKAMELLFGRAG
jgi:NRPS condensation-like uncharacterized protein